MLSFKYWMPILVGFYNLTFCYWNTTIKIKPIVYTSCQKDVKQNLLLKDKPVEKLLKYKKNTSESKVGKFARNIIIT